MKPSRRLPLTLLAHVLGAMALLACFDAPAAPATPGPPLPVSTASLSPAPAIRTRISLQQAFPSSPQALAVDPTSGDIYLVGSDGPNRPGWLSSVRHEIIGNSLRTGIDPSALAVHPTTGLVYVANKGSDDVSIVRGGQLASTVAVGRAPTSIAIDAASGLVYVANSRSSPGAVSILRETHLLAEVTVGQAPQQVAAHPTNGLVYVRNHRSAIAVLSGDRLLTTIPTDPACTLTAMTIDPVTGAVAVACGDQILTIDGTEVINTAELDGPPIEALAAGPLPGSLYAAQRNQITVLRDGRVEAVLSLMGLPAGLTCHPATGYCYAAMLLDQGDTALAVIRDTEIVTSTWAGSYPSDLTVDPSSDRAYLASDGLVILARADHLATIGLPLALHAAVASTDGTLYFAARSPGSPGDRILVVNDGALVALVPVGGFVSAIAVDATTNLLYVADRSRDQVLVISGTQTIAAVPVGQAPNFLVADPASGLLYAGHASGPGPGLGAVDVISGTDLLARLPLGESPGEAIADPRSGLVYIANRGSPPQNEGSIEIFSGTQHLATLPAGRYPHALAVDPAAGVLYVPNRDSQDVSVFRGLEATGTLPLSGAPRAACLDPITGFVHIAEEGDRVAVLHDGQLLAELAVAPRPAALVAEPHGGQIYVVGQRTPSGSSHLTVIRGTEVAAMAAFPDSTLSQPLVDLTTGDLYLFEGQRDELLVIGGSR